MRELDYSGNFYFTSRISDLSRQNLTNVPWSIKFFIIIRYEIDHSFVVIIIIFSLSLFTIPLQSTTIIHRLKISSSLPRNNGTTKHRSIILPPCNGEKEEERKRREEKGGRGKTRGRKGRERFREEKYAGSTWKRERIFPGGLFLPPSLPPSLRVEAREVARPTVKRGRGRGGEGKGRSERKTRRNGPTAQQKRDKSSTLIRILPLFALWNTILNGMGAQ